MMAHCALHKGNFSDKDNCPHCAAQPANTDDRQADTIPDDEEWQKWAALEAIRIIAKFPQIEQAVLAPLLRMEVGRALYRTATIERIGRTEAERDALKANLRQQIEGISRTRNDWINRAHELEAERDRALEALSAMIRIGEMYIEARAALASPNAKEEQSTE